MSQWRRWNMGELPEEGDDGTTEILENWWEVNGEHAASATEDEAS